MNEKKSIWPKVLLESGMIILSVLIALFINEWRNNYNEEVKTNQILANIEGEIKTNQQFIKELTVYHEGVRRRIGRAYNQDSIAQKFFSSIGFEIFEVAPDGIIQGKLHNIAWTVAKSNEITNRVSLDEAQILFAVYDQQETVNQTIDRIIDFLSSREVQRKSLMKESVIILGAEINELVGQEKNLNNRYAKALELLGKKEN